MRFDLPRTSAESVAAGERGIEQTARNNPEWLSVALEALRIFSSQNEEITIEAFRAWWMQNGGIPPISHHAYGALGGLAARRGLLRFLRFEKAKSIKTHGHPIRVYARA